MRLKFLASVLTGSLLLGWAAGASAAPTPPPATPPAEPIFYCPSGPGHADTKTPVQPAAKHAGARHRSCPVAKVARTEHPRHWRGHEDRLASRDGRGVSASQAFIYRYELRHHGFEAHAANDAWAHPDDMGPHGPRVMADGGHGGDRMGPPMVMPDHMGPPMVRPDHLAPPMRDGAHGGGHYGYLEDGGQRSGHWASGGEVRGHGWSIESDRSWGWSGHGAKAGDGEWRDGSYGRVVEYAGRDAHGYLIWPGKTPQPDPIPDPN